VKPQVSLTPTPRNGKFPLQVGTIGGSALATAEQSASFENCDVLVIGGGPAGSTIAALLAERGERVVVVEKDRHPRFHIGESLLPLNLPLFDKLGVREQVDQIGMLKYSAEFVSPYHQKKITFDFANALDKKHPYAYQVRRSEFDHILLKNAAAKGANIIEECRITQVEFPANGEVHAKGIDQAGQQRIWHAKFLVDASGRDTFLANHFKTKNRDHKHNSAAMFGHFTGAHRPAGKAEGNITIFWFDHGWFWFIPLADGTTSIGAVCLPEYIKHRKTDLTSFFRETIASCAELSEVLQDATLITPVTATGNYAYKADGMAGGNYILLGDAFAFIDPLFSTGVYLAMNSAFLGADVVSASLRAPQKQAAAERQFEAGVRYALSTFSWYIHRIASPAMRNLIMNPANPFRVQEALLSMLSGDIFNRPLLGLRLMAFKIIYYFSSMAILKQSIAAWKKRKRDIRLSPEEAT
jgi:flavin-dependent dehydrogenase